MKATQIIMGMPITVEVVDAVNSDILDAVFTHFRNVDARFSTYKDTSEISQINRGELVPEQYSAEMRQVLLLAEQTKDDTNGYFDINAPDGTIDPSGLVKGWAIAQAAQLLVAHDVRDYFIDAGGDIQVGRQIGQEPWRVGIQNPFNPQEIVKVVKLYNEGMATSGSYTRGAHIYNPKQPHQPLADIVSLTVIGPNVYEADRFATAAFAQGKEGIYLIEQQDGLEGYGIDKDGVATSTTGFSNYVIS